MSEYIIETRNITKTFSGRKALDNVDIHIKKGDIYGFIGRNGAGKTTMMKLVLGLLRPNEGEILLFGGSDNLNQKRSKIGSLIEAPGLYRNASALENMRRFAMLYGGSEKDIHEYLDLVNLAGTGSKKAGQFSLGMKQRLGLAIALLGNPEIMILDEPMNGLDPAGIKEIRDVIIKLNKEKGVTFFISSHILDELAKITTTYGIINEGKLVEEVDAEELMERCAGSLILKVSDTQKALQILKKHKLLGKYTNENGSLILYDYIDKASEINSVLVKEDVDVEEINKTHNGFEDYFIERIGK